MKLALKNKMPVILLVLALWQLGQGSYIYLKAELAQYLIAAAWQEQDKTTQIKPWPWADTWPVARLVVPQHKVDQYVLAGVSGEALAFGPGHVFSSAAPTISGNTIIAAHRDTHFSFLNALKKGELITLYNRKGDRRDYIVQDMRVVDKEDVDWINAEDYQYQLTLATCYPFDAIQAGGPLRYVVRAVSLATI
jgi:sortase A